MTVHFGTAMIIATLLASIFLLLQNGDRMFPMLATIAAGVQALLAFGVMSLSLAKFRIDVILPALLVVSGIACWLKATAKGPITAASVIALLGGLELLLALRLFA